MKRHNSQRVYSCFSNQVGSSLTELMISLALILGGIAAVLVVFQSSLKGLHQTEAKLQESGILNELHLNLNNKEVCEKNFLTKTFDESGGMNLAAIQDTLGNRIAGVNAEEPGSALRITGLKVVTDAAVWNAFQAAKSTLPAEGYLLSASLEVSIQRLRQVGGSGESTISVALPLFIDTNAAVTGCLTPMSALEEAALATSCSQVGGVIDLTTKTCRFSADCAAVTNDGKPFEGQCLNQEITELKKTVTLLEAQVNPGASATPSMSIADQMKDCMRSLDTRNISRFDGGKLQCERVYMFTATPTDINAFGYHITDPKIASQIFNDVSKDYTDFYIKTVLEGTP